MKLLKYNIKRFLSLLVVFAMLFSFVAPVASYAVEGNKEDNYKVKVRIEGNNRTIVKPITVNINSLDMSKYTDVNKPADSYDTLKPIHAIVRALEQSGIDPNDANKFKSGGGTYISNIDGLTTGSTGTMDGWMYWVDNKYADLGVDSYEITSGQEVVVFFVEDFTKNIYSWFEKEFFEVEENENFELSLKANPNPWGGGEGTGLEGASILVNNEEYMQEGEVIKTNSDGKLSLNIQQPGTYHISASKKSGEGQNILTRPYAKVVVNKSVVEEKNTISSIVAIKDIEVEYGTSEEKALLSLPKTTSIVDSKSNKHVVNLNWKIEGYLSDESGNYLAKANFDLPEGVVQTQPETELKVEANILVKEKKVKQALDLDKTIKKTLDFYKTNNPEDPDSEWEAFVGLWGLGSKLDREFEWEKTDPGFDKNIAGNETLRHAFSLLGQGKDPSDIWGGRNLFAELASQQRENGVFTDIGKHVFSMILLDTGEKIGADVGVWKEENRQTAIDELLKMQNEDGSFGAFSYLDHTGFAIIALSEYKTQSKVKASIDKALDFIKSKQTDSGGFDYNDGWEKGEDSNALSIIIQALIAADQDVMDEGGKWSKNGNTPVDSLVSYQKDNGEFLWKLGKNITGPATKQALVALSDLKNGESTWFRLAKEIDLSKEDEEDNINPIDLDEAIKKVVGYYNKNNPEDPDSEWEVFVGLWGAGEALDREFEWERTDPGFDKDVLGNETLRHAFSILSQGKDPSDIWGGRNLFAELSAQQKDNGSFTTIGKEIFSILLLDAGEKMGTDVGTWNKENKQKAIDSLLDRQNGDGSFGSFSHLDHTGWTLIALSQYTDQEEVQNAVDKAIEFLKTKQTETGSFVDNSGWGGGENSNSIASIIQGLVAVGEDVLNTKGTWAKEGKTPAHALLEFQQEDGSFWWEADKEGNATVATKQSIVALVDLKNTKSTWIRLGEEIKLDDEVVNPDKDDEIVNPDEEKDDEVIVVPGETENKPENKPENNNKPGEKPSNKPEKGNNITGNSPKTGDKGIIIPIMTLLISGVLIVAASRRKKVS